MTKMTKTLNEINTTEGIALAASYSLASGDAQQAQRDAWMRTTLSAHGRTLYTAALRLPAGPQRDAAIAAAVRA